MSEPAIQKALTAEEIFLKRDKERYLYEMREKALRMLQNLRVSH